ncbi:hypothetical protein GWI33_018051 [Rhynchophorus ferrugineus]|uniref:Uncharacterized protein n=1 Tax=Rhynchophorus ferrugineus TaxID=354439 RepID=A0A834HVK7_RHYFE|nr:hypothetical protein GWI33_018051 [Rhynchophorus ferrugineus]
MYLERTGTGRAFGGVAILIRDDLVFDEIPPTIDLRLPGSSRGPSLSDNTGIYSLKQLSSRPHIQLKECKLGNIQSLNPAFLHLGKTLKLILQKMHNPAQVIWKNVRRVKYAPSSQISMFKLDSGPMHNPEEISTGLGEHFYLTLTTQPNESPIQNERTHVDDILDTPISLEVYIIHCQMLI